MDISAYVLLSREQVLNRRLEVIANNLANSSTVGFKRELPVFHEYVATTPDALIEDARKTSFVLDYGTMHDLSQGAFQTTGNALDVMIQGNGYLNVEGPDGTTLYTRAGYIRILNGGELATANGDKLLGEGGAPIVVPPEETNKVSIAPDGSVMGSTGPLGRLAITKFPNEGTLENRGNGLWSGQGGEEVPAEEVRLKAGGVEGSNVQPIIETTTLIDVLRSYQNSKKMSVDLGDMRQRAIDKLGRVS